MKNNVCALYQHELTNLGSRLDETFEKGLARGSGRSQIFFRADDIGVPSRLFTNMVRLFTRYSTPLCLAVVPAWLTDLRWQRLRQVAADPDLFCWHQHGWSHTNHESSGKKQEFGPSRTPRQLQHDLVRGRQRLTSILGDVFFPFFTPPWNRCSGSTLELLENLRFVGVSRSSGAEPQSQPALPDIQINIDLHTRKETNFQLSLEQLLKELHNALALGTAGIMLHHQRMNTNSLLLLEKLLQTILRYKTVEPVSFINLIDS